MPTKPSHPSTPVPSDVGAHHDGSSGHLAITETYSSVHQLSDGTTIRLRLLRADDREELLAGFEQLSEESRYRRFFTSMPRLPESVLQRLLDVDGYNRVAVVAEGARDGAAPAAPFGLARFIRLEDAPDTAEAAIAVVDHMQGRGIGKLLLSVIAVAARERGITKFRADVLTTNDAMTALLRELDQSLAPLRVDGGVSVYEVALPDIDSHDAMSVPHRILKLAARGLGLLFTRLEHRRT